MPVRAPRLCTACKLPYPPPRTTWAIIAKPGRRPYIRAICPACDSALTSLTLLNAAVDTTSIHVLSWVKWTAYKTLSNSLRDSQED